MNRFRLMCFSTVAQTLNYSQAAQRLFISQSTLSRQIMKLEEELGCSLFLRDTHGVELTPAGAACLEHARAALAAYDRMAESAQRAKDSCSGAIALGYGGRSHFTYVVSAMERLQNDYPSLRISLRKDHIEGLKKGLRAGQEDAVILFEPCVEGDDDLNWATLDTCQMDAILPANHPLATRQSIDLSELAGESFVSSVRDTAPQIYDARLRLCLQAGFSARIALTSSDRILPK